MTKQSFVTRVVTAAAAAIFLMFAAQADAAVFKLYDHPDAALFKSAGVPYGLRLDSQADGASSPGSRTWSVSTKANSNVSLTWDVGTTNDAQITGTLVRNSDDSLWDVVFDIMTLTVVGGDGFTATSTSGTLTPQGGGSAISLPGAPVGGVQFVFLPDGHRLPPALSDEYVGRGWINYDGTNDWLVRTAPIPAALPLFATALAGLGIFGWRKRKVGTA